MNFFKEHKLVSISIIALVVLNLILISLIALPRLGRSYDRDRKADGRDFISRKLDFTEQQRQELHTLSEQHRSEVRALQLEVNQKRKALFELIKEGEEDSEEAIKLSADIGKNVAAIESATFNHFIDIRELCTDEQKVKLDSLLQDIAKRRGPGADDRDHERRRPPPPGN